ncbi:RBBP9/YdeN family alpha/beta hydrolase [Agromyces italicus]|uniref:RBBP9/YdeN family alpha/beta hydrolase n=1 Tax=Agromyces italicus TaxID=279572 RepID=UPI0003B5B626|nr:alpha/beta hydrolase [Agromyces italicus]
MGDVLILHGWQNHRPEGHWQRWLAGELAARGHRVRYPQLPDADAPDPAAWLEALERELAATRTESLTVVAHSLGGALWAAFAQARAELGIGEPAAARVVLVAPPSDAFLASQPVISGFLGEASGGVRDGGTVDRASALAAASFEPPVLVTSDDDRVSPTGSPSFAELYGIVPIIVPGAGHFALPDGYGPLPLVLELVEGDATAG